jgi:YidC/Oxa1 family membrane protein insertase
VGSIGGFFGALLAPIGTLFHILFYLPIFNILILLYRAVNAVVPAWPTFAIAIILLTVMIRLALFPLTRKQLQSTRSMQALQPQIAELKKQYPNDPQGLMRAQQALYREHGVSMYGGCLPMLMQMPFLYGIYFSLYTALIATKVNNVVETAGHHLGRINHDIYPFMPHLTTLPYHHFLWTDLGAADPYKILPLLAGILTFVQLRMAQPVKAPTPVGQKPDPNTQAMGSMQYVMPFITFIMALNFPSGLAFYWTITTAFMAVQQYFLSGWGSLFVGIPGMEHLVPEPQRPAVLPARATPAAASIVDVTPTANPPRGLSGLREALRQLSAPPPQPNAGPSNGNGASNGANGASMNGNVEAERVHHSSVNGGAPYSKKAKPDQLGPKLVRPDGQPSAAPGGAGDSSARVRRPVGQGSAGSSGARSGRSAAGRKRSGGKSRGGR